jgi:hypothetical protein
LTGEIFIGEIPSANFLPENFWLLVKRNDITRKMTIAIINHKHLCFIHDIEDAENNDMLRNF